LAIKCPRCPVTEPAIGCVDLLGTSFGTNAELQWCPTLAAAMPKDTIWSGKAQRALIEVETTIVRASKGF